MIKTVLFDYGGVLSPGGKDLIHVYSQLLNLPDDKIDLKPFHHQLRCGLISTEDFFTKLSQRYGKTITAQEFMEHSDIYQKEPAVYDLAKRLRAHGIKTGVLSNMYKMSADKLRQDGYYDGFDPVILSCQEKLAKPDPEFYKLAVKRSDCQPEEIIFVDDQEKCLPPALAIGMKVIKAESADQVITDVKKLLIKENGLSV